MGQVPHGQTWGPNTLPPTNMEVQKRPFQEESSLSTGVWAQTHVSWWEVFDHPHASWGSRLEPRQAWRHLASITTALARLQWKESTPGRP